MPVTVPPCSADTSDDRDLARRVADLEALIEEARRRARRRRRFYGAAALVVIAAFAAALFGIGTGAVVHRAGVPAAGVEASTPTTDHQVVSLRIVTAAGTDTDWDAYADGRLIWQRWSPAYDATVIPAGARRLDTSYVQQRLTPQGVRLIRSKLLATGLFAHNLRLQIGQNQTFAFDDLQVGDHSVTVVNMPAPHVTKATPRQVRAITWIERFVAAPVNRLPASAWADRRIRAFVPSCYGIDIENGYPNPSRLPAPAGTVLARDLERHDRRLTTGEERALLHAFAQAGIKPAGNHVGFRGFRVDRWVGHRSYLALFPVLPGDCS